MEDLRADLPLLHIQSDCTDVCGVISGLDLCKTDQLLIGRFLLRATISFALLVLASGTPDHSHHS